MTGFPTSEMADFGVAQGAPWLPEVRLIKAGARYVQGQKHTDVVVVDGNLVTGQNGASSKRTAQAVVEHVGKTAHEVRPVVSALPNEGYGLAPVPREARAGERHQHCNGGRLEKRTSREVAEGPIASLRDRSKRPFDRLVAKRRPSADDVPHLRGARSLDVHQSQRLAVKRVLDQVVGAARDLNTAAAAMRLSCGSPG